MYSFEYEVFEYIFPIVIGEFSINSNLVLHEAESVLCHKLAETPVSRGKFLLVT